MSKQVTIPSNMNPWWCNINGVVYSYTAGSTQTVPDEVAAVIENYNNMLPKLDEPLKNKLYGTGNSGEPCLYDKGSFEGKEKVFYIYINPMDGIFTINGISSTDVNWTSTFTEMRNAWANWISDSYDSEKIPCTILINSPAIAWVGNSNSLSQDRAYAMQDKIKVDFLYAGTMVDGVRPLQVQTYGFSITGQAE